MDINITGRNLELDDAIKEYIHRRLDKLDRLYRRIYKCEVILEEEKISEESISHILKKKKGTTSVYDLPLFKPLKEGSKTTPGAALPKPPPEHPMITEINELDVNSMTPMEALMKIAQWKRELEKERDES